MFGTFAKKRTWDGAYFCGTVHARHIDLWLGPRRAIEEGSHHLIVWLEVLASRAPGGIKFHEDAPACWQSLQTTSRLYVAEVHVIVNLHAHKRRLARNDKTLRICSV